MKLMSHCNKKTVYSYITRNLLTLHIFVFSLAKLFFEDISNQMYWNLCILYIIKNLFLKNTKPLLIFFIWNHCISWNLL